MFQLVNIDNWLVISVIHIQEDISEGKEVVIATKKTLLP